MTHMLCEILAQALGQINSVATRLRLGFPASPRQLRTLILTLPSAMPKQEREIFRQRMFEALALVWKAMGWHPQDEDFTTPKQREKSVVPVPEIQMEWTKQVVANWYGFITKPFRITPGVPNPFLMHSPDRIASLNPASSPDARCAWHRLISAVARRIWRLFTIS